jgi:hypothetical protein
MAGIKIVNLPAVGRDLISTDLFELSLAGGSGSRKITGQEIMNASKLNVGGTPIINGTAGRILFQGASDTLGESANLFWDNTNNRLGIGGSPAVYNLDVKGIGIYRGGLLDLQNTTGNVTLSFYPSAGNLGIINSDILRLGRISNGTIFLQGFADGNIAINSSTNAGYKLDVNGTARVSSTITLTGVNTPNLANLPIAIGNFTLDIQTTNPNSAASSIITTGAITRTDSGVKSIINVNNAVTSTAANFNALNGFAFTSTISQTLGTIRGIYIAPTLTASTDFRAIETTAGNVLFNGGSVGVGTTTPTGRNGYGGGTAIEVVNNSTYASFNLNGGNIASPTYLTLGAQGGGADIRVNNKPFQMTINSIDAFKISTTGNIGINTTTDAGYKLDVNGITRLTGNVTVLNGRLDLSHNFNLRVTNQFGTLLNGMKGNSTGQIEIGDGNTEAVQIANNFLLVGTATKIQSSILTLQSTTQGFLPPRMTNAQRTAIASPAVGLIVYCTDATEGLWIYKSSGWTFIV